MKKGIEMKKLLLTLAVSAMVSLPVAAQGVASKGAEVVPAAVDSKCQWINGYTRSDGTYVQGHWRGC